jgi:acetyltransferase-like isoleucine patch superfamily enzyme
MDGRSQGVVRSLVLTLRRFFVPGFVVTGWAYFRWRALVSPRSEVELSRHLVLGRRTVVSSFVKIKATDGPVTCGADCGIATGCFLDGGTAGLRLGNHVTVGPNVVMVAVNYRYDQLEVPVEQQGRTSQGITIGDNVWIGANSVILDGASIGDHSIVVANSLVNRRFPPRSIIQGNPAKVILERRSSAGDPAAG